MDARARLGVPSVFPSDLATYPARSREKALAHITALPLSLDSAAMTSATHGLWLCKCAHPEISQRREAKNRCQGVVRPDTPYLGHLGSGRRSH